VAVRAAAADTTTSLEEEAALGRGLVPAPADDLERIQGLWTRTERTGLFAKQRVNKEVKGDTETVTYYDSSDEVASAHTVKIELYRAGPLKIFAFRDQTFTAGPNEGEKHQGPVAYVYKVVGDTFIEIWGVLEEDDSTVRVLRWTRASSNDSSQQ
jgi:hypothetical protein